MSWIILEQEQIFYSFILFSLTLETGILVPSLFFCVFIVQFPFITSGDRWFCYIYTVASVFVRCLLEDSESLERQFSITATWIFFLKTSST